MMFCDFNNCVPVDENEFMDVAAEYAQSMEVAHWGLQWCGGRRYLVDLDASEDKKAVSGEILDCPQAFAWFQD